MANTCRNGGSSRRWRTAWACRGRRDSVPLWVARLAAWWLEGRARKRGDPQPPRLTQGRLKFLGLNLDFSIEKAKRVLGYQPRVAFADGMRQTIDWLKQTDLNGLVSLKRETRVHPGRSKVAGINPSRLLNPSRTDFGIRRRGSSCHLHPRTTRIADGERRNECRRLSPAGALRCRRGRRRCA